MNERIKQLAARAGVLADFGEDIKVGRWGIGGSYQSMEKFAELIVQECAGVTLDYKNHDHYTGWCDHAAEILKHFGVE